MKSEEKSEKREYKKSTAVGPREVVIRYGLWFAEQQHNLPHYSTNLVYIPNFESNGGDYAQIIDTAGNIVALPPPQEVRDRQGNLIDPTANIIEMEVWLGYRPDNYPQNGYRWGFDGSTVEFYPLDEKARKFRLSTCIHNRHKRNRNGDNKVIATSDHNPAVALSDLGIKLKETGQTTVNPIAKQPQPTPAARSDATQSNAEDSN